MIPPIIHRVWIGDTFPEKYSHPEDSTFFDEVFRWVQDSQDELLFYARCRKVDFFLDLRKTPLYTMYTRCINPSNKVNLLRILILDKIGGVYCDTDVHILRSPDPLLERDFFAAREPHPPGYIGCAIIGSERSHPITQKLISHYAEHFKPQPDSVRDQVLHGGPGLFSQVINEYREVLVESDLLYPLSYQDMHPLRGKLRKSLPAGTQAFFNHLWEGSWTSHYQKKR